MAVAAPFETGLVFWAEKDAATHIAHLKSFGLRVCQLGVAPTLDTTAAVNEWKEAIERERIIVSGAVVAYTGEDYANLAKVHETVGFTAPGYAAERIARTKQASDFAAALGITSLSCHIGFIPEEQASPIYTELIGIARELCDACAANNQDFVLETGQESAYTLLQFLADVKKPNLKVNFDPANMILYGSGDPIAALDLLQKHVGSVHCKDGTSPKSLGELGSEVALGNGEVDFPAFFTTLKKIGFTGPLVIEREEPNAEQRDKDIRLAIERITEWKKQIA
jgi:sugar phosphate isomerase/epimerase